MKKILLFLIAFACNTAVSATEITNPFYVSPKGIATLETEASFKKFHVRELINGFEDYRTRDRFIGQAFSYGISPKVAVLATISNAWERQTFDDSGMTAREDSNVDWSVGALYDLYNQNDMYLQLRMVYLQKEMHDSRGAYKAFNANVKTGYDLTYFLPYIGAEIELPIGQSKQGDDKPKYDAYAGIYKNFSDIIASDMTIHYNYDKLYKSKKWNGRAELSYFLTTKMALSGYFDYTFSDKGKNNAEADAHTIGGILRIQF